MWLPIEQTVVFEWIDPAGRKMTFGSTGGLLRELEELNERTWEADDEALDKARRENVDPDATLEECAKFALGLMLGLTRDAVAHDLPMKLDY
jgi:hypothetical protein